MAKTFKITVTVVTENGIQPNDFILHDADVIDGFELSRSHLLGDVTAKFYLKHAFINEVQEIKP